MLSGTRHSNEQVYLTRGSALNPDSHQAALRRVHSYLSFPYIQSWWKLCQDHRTVLRRRKIAAIGKTRVYLIPPVVTALLNLIHHIISTAVPNECVCVCVWCTVLLSTLSPWPDSYTSPPQLHSLNKFQTSKCAVCNGYTTIHVTKTWECICIVYFRSY
jgi:hypothetical protein